MIIRNFLFVILMWLAGAGGLSAQSSAEGSLPLDGQILPGQRTVTLSWLEAEPPRAGSVTVKRRVYGQTGGESWVTIAAALGPVMRYTDTTILPGVAYEYQVLRTARDIIDVGYWVTGTDLPVEAGQAVVHLVVDQTIAEDIAPRLNRFIRDQLGAGRIVRRVNVPRGSPKALRENLAVAVQVKNWLKEAYDKVPAADHAVILIGRVPILRSGKVAPDGHAPEAHATDLFYVDLDGRWQAQPDGLLLNRRLPDSTIEMQIGRIDFSPVSTDREQEIHLIRAYFDKTHHWRHGLIGDLRKAYGQSSHLKTEQLALRNIVGPAAVTPGGHHDVGEAEPWLWGVDFGKATGRSYAEELANKAIFAINFGSAKQKIERRYNELTALLAQPWYPVAVGWGGRPAWWLHHMALGGTIGDVHMATVNNGDATLPYRETMDYFPTGPYLWRNPIWVNLLGDPTLHAFPLAPPSAVKAAIVDEGVAVTWQPSPDPDVLGYRVFRAPEGSQAFVAIDGGILQSGLVFTDTDPLAQARYMVWAYGKKRVYAGSFFTFSQGRFADVGYEPLLATDMSLQTTIGQPVDLPQVFADTGSGLIYSIIEGPEAGSLHFEEGTWRYHPPEFFKGTMALRFSVSDILQTAQGVLTITVDE